MLTRTGPNVNAWPSNSSKPLSAKYAGAKWYWTSGAGRPGRVRTNANASATVDVSGPLRRSIHSSVGLGLSAPYSDSGTDDSQMQTTYGWSWRFSPTPGRSWLTGTPTERRWSAGPIPESSSSCGEPIAPALRITSRSAPTTRSRRPGRGCARPSRGRPTSSTPSTVAWVTTSRFGRFMFGRRYASAALNRAPLRCVTWTGDAPSCSGPL